MNIVRRRRWSRPLFLVAVALSIGTFSLIAFLPRDWVTIRPDDHSVEAVTVFRPWVGSFIGVAGLTCFTGLLAWGFLGLYRRTYVVSILAIATAFLGPVAIVVSFFQNMAPWVVYSDLTAPDGAVYCFAESSFLQGQTLMLGRLREKTPFTQTYDALVITHGDSPRSYLRIVRPAGAEDSYGQLLLTHDSWLLGMRSENRCFFAYDLNLARPYGYGPVEGLSPFLPLDGAMELHEPDVALLLAGGIEREKGSPKMSVIREALEHPNPRVRVIASELLGAK